MSRADETTQVDYSLLDDAQLGDAVAEKVLSLGYAYGNELVSWWGAGLVIDTLRAEGWAVGMLADSRTTTSDIVRPGVEGYTADDKSPVRSILIAALRAKEAE